MQCKESATTSDFGQRPLSPLAQRISTFVVLDLETNDLPYLMSKVAITELSAYAFDATALELESCTAREMEQKLPEMPRVLHKLTILFNPGRIISHGAERVTGLNNYILEHESLFNENAGTLFTSFLKHLKQPVCLVAHNGDKFDFPIIKQTLQKLNVELPNDTLCVDSLRAFWGIDDQIMDTSLLGMTEEIVQNHGCITKGADETDEVSEVVEDVIIEKTSKNNESIPTGSITSVDKENNESAIDWQKRNESTPKRRIVVSNDRVGSKRHACDMTPVCDSPIARRRLNGETLRAKRSLFPHKPTKKFPPKGKYILSSLYERVFHQCPQQAHHAEADVDALTKLMLAYGMDFLAYAENHAIPFAEVCA